MSGKKLLGVIAALAGLTGTVTAGHAQEALRIGTSGSGSVFYTLAVGMSQMLRTHAGVNSSVESVGGSHANVFAMMNDQVDLAIINAMAAFQGANGLAPIPNKVPVCLVAQGQPSLRQVFVRRGAEINSPADLKGKTWMTTMPSNPDIAEISKTLMDVAGIDPTSFQDVTMVETSEAVAGFEAGTIDAVTMPASARAPHITRLMESEAIDFLYIPDDMAKSMLDKLPRGLAIYKLDAKVYPNMRAEANTFGVRTYLVANCNLPADQIYNVSKAVLDNVSELATYHPSGRDYNVDATVSDPVIPFHAGTVRYLKEKGVWTPELEAAQTRTN